MTAEPGFRGAIFDVDGVLVDSPHEAAWRESLAELMEGDWADIREQTTWTPTAFTAEVYQQVVSGKPRMDGALAALEHFAVPEASTRVEAYAAHKQEKVVALIEAGKFSAYPDALGWPPSPLWMSVRTSFMAVFTPSVTRGPET